MTPQEVKYLVVHCAATPPTMDIGAKEIDRWHRANGWLCIGYHFVIRRDGTVENGRDLSMVGAHEPAVNRVSLGICMVGGVDADMKAENNFTPAQFESLKTLLAQLRHDGYNGEVIGHRDVNPHKDCPSFDAKAWWKTQQEKA